VKIAFIILSFLFSGDTIPVNNAEQVISCHYSDVSFSSFCDSIESRTGVKVYYKQDWINELNVNISEDSIQIVQAFNKILNNSGLEVSIWHNDLIILPGKKLIAGLPQFKQNGIYDSQQIDEENKITKTEEKYITGRKADAVKVLHVGKSELAGNKFKSKVLGKIIEKETGEPIIGGTMFLEETKTGAASDLNGYVTMFLVPGKYNATFESLGFKTIKYFLHVHSDGNFTISMDKSLTSIDEVVVYGDKQSNVKLKDPGLEKVSIRTIKEVPMMMGERDILRVSEMLPGIVSVGEGSAGLNVRGGNSDQNAFYINNIPIYNTYHLFGFFPAFNSDIIKDFSIYKGHIPAQYGGKLSSVFNIVTKQGNKRNFGARGGINPISANLTLEGPIIKDTCSILISGRSLYSDWILSRIHDPTIKTSSASFNDISASVNYDFEKTNIFAFAYASSDYFQLADINQYNYANKGASLNIRHFFNSSFSGNLALVASQYGFNTVDKQEVSVAYEHNYLINHYEAKAHFKQSINDNIHLDYGANSIIYSLDRGTVMPYGEESLRNIIELGEEKGMENALFISNTSDLLPRLNVTLGFRYTLYTPLGPNNAFLYAEGTPKDERYIIDSLAFGNNEAMRWYSEPDFRAAINYETDPEGSIKLAFNQMHQNLFMLSNTITVAPNTQWKLADYHLKPSQSDQLSLGVFRNIPRGSWETSLEVYYKRTQNYTEFKDGANFINSSIVETAVLQGNQKAYGIEFSLKRNQKKLDGWLSYAYSRSIVQIDGVESWDRINKGMAYPANFDIPHAFNAVMNYHHRRRLTLSSVVTYQTGRPVTYPTVAYYIENVLYTDYSTRNKYRIPDYFRVDLSLTIEGNLKKNKLIHSSFMFSVYNATGRKNPYSVYSTKVDGKIQSYKYSVIGVPFFTITWLFKLGNYATD